MPDYRLVVGYTTNWHLLVDLDGTKYYKVKKLVVMMLNEFTDLGSCLIVRSSSYSYHLIFGKRASWQRIMHIIDILAGLGIVEEAYRDIRKMRGDLTLRISPKVLASGIKEVPEPIMLVGKCFCDECLEGIYYYVAALATFLNIDKSCLDHAYRIER